MSEREARQAAEAAHSAARDTQCDPSATEAQRRAAWQAADAADWGWISAGGEAD